MNQENKENKKKPFENAQGKKKKARKLLVAFLKKLRKKCGTFSNIDQWYEFIKGGLDPIVEQYGKALPEGVAEKLEETAKITDATKEGINQSCKLLQNQLGQVIKTLPAGGLLSGGLLTTFLGISIVVGIGVAVLNFISVKVVIKNHGCDTIYPVVWMPVKLPGLSLPTLPIPDGGQGEAQLPPLKFTVVSTKSNLQFQALGMSFNFELKNKNIDLLFNNKSLIGTDTQISLKERPQHELLVSCR